MPVISINGNKLDPSEATPHATGLRLLVANAQRSDYILIQSSGPLTNDQKTTLTGLGVVIHEYVSQNTYLCGYKPADLGRIRALPYIVYANVYARDFKVAKQLKSSQVHTSARMASSSEIPLSAPKTTVDIVFHEDLDPNTVKAEIATRAHVAESEVTVTRNKVRLAVAPQDLNDLASIDAVRDIQEVYPVRLLNNVARGIMKADVTIAGTAYQGEGQVVCVADTGFDNGKTAGSHPAFAGRVAKLYSLGRLATGKADDPQGHGTHVSGSVLGNGFSASMGGKIQGTAPKATLVVQSCYKDSDHELGGLPAHLGDLFAPPYTNDNVRVHTNSWGSGEKPFRQLEYGQAKEIDEFVWNHPDMVICFAAGNDGIDDPNADGTVDLREIGAEASAKNIITVGASESLRPENKLQYGQFQYQTRPHGPIRFRFPVAPLQRDTVADNIDGMAAFSSRGPTLEQRRKPDIVAPGTAILSARSSVSTPGTDWGVSSDPAWCFEGGTSMATPLVAGCVAVLRETLVKNGSPTPSAALIKALLINGADVLLGQYTPSEAGAAPNDNSGYGRVNLANSIIIPTTGNVTAGFKDGGPLSQGQQSSQTIQIPGKINGGSKSTSTSTGATLKVTLAYSDPPGDMLQNDLNLIVIGSNGTERHGNMGTSAGFDSANNVEQIIWADMPAGPAQIIVRAASIPKFPQPYAYAWRLS